MICPYCRQPAEWCENKAIYGRNFGKSWMCYYCRPCGAYVGCHQNSRRALGTMANAELRAWRVKAHAAIDPLWRSGQMKRTDVYHRLRIQFGREIHVGASDLDACRTIIATVESWRKKGGEPCKANT